MFRKNFLQISNIPSNKLMKLFDCMLACVNTR
ncbi:hypothetical protein BCEN4_740078 [Burkholderia cenocepacia]|nr:hypothetical protein BCEN4_740078 [Burkholderia cenocepacia]